MTFVDTVRREQLRYLAAVSAAQVHLGESAPLVTAAAGLHARFTRQVFDAQRSLLQRRVQLAQELQMIDEPSSRSALAAADHDDAAGTGALSRLTTLLDAWWRAEVADGNALLATARDANAMTDLPASTHEGGAAADEGTAGAASCGAPALPEVAERMLTALRSAQPSALNGLLADLAASLVPAPPTTPATPDGSVPLSLPVSPNAAFTGSVAQRRDDVLIRLDPVPRAHAATTPGTQVASAFDEADPWVQFWNQDTSPRPTRHTPRRARRWLQLGPVASGVLLTAMLPAVLAWAR